MIVAGGYVAVADGVNPPRVSGRADRRRRDSRRLACAVPVFQPGAGQRRGAPGGGGPLDRRRQRLRLREPDARPRRAARRSAASTRVVVGKPRLPRGLDERRDLAVGAGRSSHGATGLLYTLVKPRGRAGRVEPRGDRLAHRRDAVRGARRARAWATTARAARSSSAPDGTAYAGTFGGVVRFRDAA